MPERRCPRVYWLVYDSRKRPLLRRCPAPAAAVSRGRYNRDTPAGISASRAVHFLANHHRSNGSCPGTPYFDGPGSRSRAEIYAG